MNLYSGGEIPEEVGKVLSVLQEKDIPYQLRIFDQPAHHARQAAALLGCKLGAVVKSLILQAENNGDFVLVLVSGKNRVDLQLIKKILGMQVKIADPAVVFRRTGYPVGAVPPFGLKVKLPVIIDADLLDYPYLWASAGDTQALVGMASEALPLVLDARVCAIH